jgi:hypothetical protein
MKLTAGQEKRGEGAPASHWLYPTKRFPPRRVRSMPPERSAMAHPARSAYGCFLALSAARYPG